MFRIVCWLLGHIFEVDRPDTEFHHADTFEPAGKQKCACCQRCGALNPGFKAITAYVDVADGQEPFECLTLADIADRMVARRNAELAQEVAQNLEPSAFARMGLPWNVAAEDANQNYSYSSAKQDAARFRNH